MSTNKRKTTDDAVVTFYNTKHKQNTQERKASPLYDVRVFNNFIKSTIITSHISKCKSAVVLDMCGGTYGDLPKFGKVAENIKEVILVDIASDSVEEAKRRYNVAIQQRQSVPKTHFYVCDAFNFDDMERTLGNGMKGDVDYINCQFALHYAAKNAETLEEAMRVASFFLKRGGVMCCTFPSDVYIVGSLDERGFICTPTFQIESISDNEYLFSMGEAVHQVPEYMVYQSTLRESALKWGMDVSKWLPFQDHYDAAILDSSNLNLARKLGCDVPTSDAWNTAALYVVVEIIKK